MPVYKYRTERTERTSQFHSPCIFPIPSFITCSMQNRFFQPQQNFYKFTPYVNSLYIHHGSVLINFTIHSCIQGEINVKSSILKKKFTAGALTLLLFLMRTKPGNVIPKQLPHIIFKKTQKRRGRGAGVELGTRLTRGDRGGGGKRAQGGKDKY